MPPNYPPGTNSLPPGGTLIINQTPIIGGTNGYVLYNNNGVVGVEAGGGGLTVGTTTISGGTANYALTVDPTGLLLNDAPIRTILTGNLSLYVTILSGTIVGGSAYTDGTYGTAASPISLTGYSGATAPTAIIVVSGGVVTKVIPVSAGSSVVGDVLSASAASIGGTGAGFTFTVTAVGSDSYNGSSATYTGGVNGPWATLQHVFSYLEATYIFQAAKASVNIAAGSYVGFGITAVQGSGLIQLIGAGATQVTITTGPNDGFFNTGECWSGYTFTGLVVAVDGVTFDVSAVPSGISGINYGVPGNIFSLGNFFTQSTDIAFAGNIADNVYLATTAPVEFSNQEIGAGTGITFPGGATCNYAIFLSNGTQFIDSGTWKVSTGTLTCTTAFIDIAAGSTYQSIGGTGNFSGTVAGARFNIVGNSSASSDLGAGGLGPTFFPGNAPGYCDASSSYDGFPGLLPTAFANLPSPSICFGLRVTITDGQASLAWSSIVTVGGGNVPTGLWSDGINWRVDVQGVVPAGDIVFNQALGSNGSGNEGYSSRQFVTALVNSLGMVMVTFQIPTGSGTFKANNCSIAVKGTATAPNTQATPTELLFSGVSGFSVAYGSGTITSDPVSLSFSAGDILCVVLDEAASVDTGVNDYTTGVSGANLWQKAATASYNQSTVSGFSDSAGYVENVTEIVTS